MSAMCCWPSTMRAKRRSAASSVAKRRVKRPVKKQGLLAGIDPAAKPQRGSDRQRIQLFVGLVQPDLHALPFEQPHACCRLVRRLRGGPEALAVLVDLLHRRILPLTR